MQMQMIKKNIEKIFKNFFYFIFSIFHGKIKGTILAKNDSKSQFIENPVIHGDLHGRQQRPHRGPGQPCEEDGGSARIPPVR